MGGTAKAAKTEVWLTIQSDKNRSPLLNSLLTGKLTGNFGYSGAILRFEVSNQAAPSMPYKPKFPTQWNREILWPNREFLFADQGIWIWDVGFVLSR
jgi:hypothetical protein